MADADYPLSPLLPALEVLVGTWSVQVQLAGMPAGRAVFAWALTERYVVQHVDVSRPEFPDSLAVIAPDDASGGYLQHYFDSRGVARLYAMTLDATTWMLERRSADFSALNFHQRFRATISADRNSIDGRWETSKDDGATWRLDFGLSYTRVHSPAP